MRVRSARRGSAANSSAYFFPCLPQYAQPPTPRVVAWSSGSGYAAARWRGSSVSSRRTATPRRRVSRRSCGATSPMSSNRSRRSVSRGAGPCSARSRSGDVGVQAHLAGTALGACVAKFSKSSERDRPTRSRPQARLAHAPTNWPEFHGRSLGTTLAQHAGEARGCAIEPESRAEPAPREGGERCRST
jgi:hypothetical protein